jgi:hypothetical protein
MSAGSGRVGRIGIGAFQPTNRLPNRSINAVFTWQRQNYRYRRQPPVIYGKSSDMDASRLLRRKAASEYLAAHWGVSRAPATLAKLATIGGGPVFRRIGRIPLYASEDLDEWVASKLSAPMHSTSESAPVRVRAKGKADGGAAPRNEGGIIT